MQSLYLWWACEKIFVFDIRKGEQWKLNSSLNANKDYLCREFSSLHNKNDVLFIFSTSGGNFKKKQSINLIKLAKFAKKKKIPIISLLGKGGGALKKLSDILIIVDSSNTASIQETHKIIFHSICETFEKY